jgi:CheY-like chemotaxis protein
MKILLVDDDTFLRDMYATKFSEHGHTVETVESGPQALLKLEQASDYDVVLLDIVMPGMTGVELLRRIQKDFPNLKAKRIVLSNQGQDEDVREAMAAGATAYIVKANSIPSEVLKLVEEMGD